MIKVFLFIFWVGSLFAEPPEGRERLDSVLSKFRALESFRATVTVNGTLTGVLSYKTPFQLHVRWNDGRIISANGKILWFYNPDTSVSGKQDLKGSSGGLDGLLSGYENVSCQVRSCRLTSIDKKINEIFILFSDNDMPRTIKMKRKDSDDITEIAFSGITTNLGLGAGLFNFQPPTTSQIVENPLNQKE